jgi:hypothetical protein
VLSWRLSITMEADFCIEAVEEHSSLLKARNILPTNNRSPPLS